MAATEYPFGSLNSALRQKVKDKKLAGCYHRLHDELTLLTVCLRGLMRDLSTLPEEQRESLLQLGSEAAAEAWKDEAVTQALEQRLGDSNEAFRDNLDQVLAALEEIISNQSMKLDPRDLLAKQAQRPLYSKLKQLRQDSGSNREGFAARIRFTSKEGKLNKSLKKLSDCNKMLERLLLGPPMPNPSNVAGDAILGKAPTRKVCELTRQVYDSLASHWSCDCAAQHEARLCMNVRYGSEVDTLLTKLDMFISVSDVDARAKWQESSVHLDTDLQPDVPAVDPSARVKFKGDEAQDRSGTRPRKSSATERNQLKEIDAMCTLIKNSYRSDVCLELLQNRDSLRHIRSSRRRTKVQEPQPSTTLHDVLCGAKRLTNKDRRQLAVILANALLHLKDSLWLEDNWTNKDVCFMVVNDSIDFCRPYLASGFSNAANQNDDPDSFQLHQSPALLHLGIILLELGISTPIEAKRLDGDLVDGNVNVNTDLSTAERVLEQSVDELHDGYRAAVQACLDCKFVPADGSFDFDNEAFRRSVYEHVVKPLEMELYYGWKLKPEDLW